MHVQVAAVSTAGKAYVWRCGVKEDGRLESAPQRVHLHRSISD